MMKTAIAALVCVPSLAFAIADLPTYPTEYMPGDVTPVTANNRSVCATVTITGASNASPIVVTTGGHFWVTGQTVTIAGVGGNTAANGSRVITRISSTQFSLNGTTGNDAYTSGGTAACDYSNLQTAIDAEAVAGNVTFWLNQGETYTSSLALDAMRAGFFLPSKSSTAWTVIRTWDDGTGKLPSNRQRVRRTHQANLAKISSTTAVQTKISCGEGANYYWLKTLNLVTPAGQVLNDGIGCQNEWGAVSANPPRKWIKNITDSGGGVVTVDIDAGRMANGAVTGYHRLPVGINVVFTGCTQCAALGLSGAKNVDTNSNRVVTITNATNDSPIVVTTAQEHYWVTGQTVTISGIVGNTAANGSGKVITRIDASTFSINSSTGNGDYVSGGTVQSPFPDRFTVSGSLTGTYTYNANDWVGIDPASFPSHLVMEQIWIETPNFSTAASNRQSINSAVNMSGEDIVFRDSHIDVCGPTGAEAGRGILMSLYGPYRAVIENNYIAACSFELFMDSNGHIFNTMPTDITIRGNTITRRSSSLPNSSDTSTEWRRLNTTVKNNIETKGGNRIRLTGNYISRGYPDDQSTIIHFTNRPNLTGSDWCGGVSTGVEGEGCHPATGLFDVTIDHNIMANIGADCIDLVGQVSRAGSVIDGYTGVRANRFLVEHNLLMNCAGYPKDKRHLSVTNPFPGSAIIINGGPQNVTIRHNTMTVPDHFGFTRPTIKHFCGPADNPANGAMVNTDGVTRTGSWTACNQPSTGGYNDTGVSPNLTIQDNIMWVSSTSLGVYGMAATGGGTQIKCNRADAFNPGTNNTGTWTHNILVGSVGTLSGATCDMNVVPGTQNLSTGSLIVANEAAMNYDNLGKKRFKLTPSSPGYQAASDGTDIGVNWDELMSAVRTATSLSTVDFGLMNAWLRQAPSPLFGGSSGSFAADAHVWANGPNDYYMVYTSEFSGAQAIGMARSSNLTAWTPISSPQYSSEHILRGAGPAAGQANQETAFYYKTPSGQHQIYYIGYDNEATYQSQIYRATAPSIEGPYTRESSPVLSFGSSGSYDDAAMTSPSIVEYNGVLYMCYVAWADSPVVPSPTVINAGATSTDGGSTWTKTGTISFSDMSGVEGHIEKGPDGRFYRVATETINSADAISVGVSVHPFGPYAKHAGVLVPGGAGVGEVDSITAASIFFNATDRRAYMYYSAVAAGGFPWMTSLAVTRYQ